MVVFFVMKHLILEKPTPRSFWLGAIFVFALTVIVAPSLLYAQQETSTQNTVFEANARAASAGVLVAGNANINLWGVEEIGAASPTFQLRARTALANAVSSDKVQCEIKKRDTTGLWAQCESADDVDLSLFMIQQGFVTVDRAAVYGSVFEDAYVQAEMEAQDKDLGIWGEKSSSGNSGQGNDGALMISLGFVLFLCIIAAFTALSIIIMRGFKQVITAQKASMNLMARERKVKDKERSIVAVMFDSELKANKSKIEAYLVVYEEMLSALRDPERPPKYKKAGDVVQMKPALSREVFDRNTDKLDSMGRELSSAIIHFYARIKTNPDYQNLDPDTPLDEAIAVVEDAVKGGRRLNDLADKLIQMFEESGVTDERPQN